MELKLQERKCGGCSNHFRVLRKSPQKYCSNNCLYFNEGKPKRDKKRAKAMEF